MSGDESLLKGKHILAVDDEKDILEIRPGTIKMLQRKLKRENMI